MKTTQTKIIYILFFFAFSLSAKSAYYDPFELGEVSFLISKNNQVQLEKRKFNPSWGPLKRQWMRRTSNLKSCFNKLPTGIRRTLCAPCLAGKKVWRDLVADGIVLSLVGTGTWALLNYTATEDGLNNPVAFIAGPVIAALTGKQVLNFWNNLLIVTCPYLAPAGLRKVADLNVEYTNLKGDFSNDMCAWFEANIERYEFVIKYYGLALKELETALELALSLPTKPKVLDPQLKESRKKFVKIKALLHSYPENVQISMVRFIGELMELSKQENPQRRPTPIVLIGPPGTGKTYLIDQILKILDLPMFLANPTQYRQLGGTVLWSNDPERGLLVDAYSSFKQSDKTAPSNGVLVFDEIDKIFVQNEKGDFMNPNATELLHILFGLLETQTKEVPLKFFENAKFSTKHLSVVLIVNKPLREVFEKMPSIRDPLVERTTEVIFKGYGEAEKREIAKEVTRKFRATHQETIEVDDKVIESIITEDQSPGVRQMLILLNQYLNDLLSAPYWSQMTEVEKPSFDVEAQRGRLEKDQVMQGKESPAEDGQKTGEEGGAK